MSQGEGGGRPRKHPHDPAIGQYAIDAEWQEIADIASEKAIIRNYYRSDEALAERIDGAGDKSGRFAAITLAILEISKDANKEDIDSLYDCVERYINFCYKYNISLTNLGCYGACGVSNQTISEWAHGRNRAARDPRYKEFAIRVRQLCGINREQMMVEGKLNPIIGIWWQKNFDGFTDKPVDVIDDTDDAMTLSESEIAKKYEGIGDD